MLEQGPDTISTSIPIRHVKHAKEDTQTTPTPSVTTPWIPPLFYILSSTILLLMVFIILNTTVFRVKITSAMVNSVIEPMLSPTDGYLKSIAVSQGQEVAKDSPLFTLENSTLERKYQLARIKIKEAKYTRDYFRALLNNEQERLNLYQKIGQDRLTLAKASARVSQKQLLTATHKIERLNDLVNKNYVSKAEFENEEAELLKAQEQLIKDNARKHLEKNSLRAIQSGLYFTGSKTEGVLADLNAQYEAAKHTVQLYQQRAQVYRDLINRLTVRAPFAARVVQVLKSVGNSTDAQNPIVILEDISTDKTILAFLTQYEILHIKSKKNAMIYLPNSGKTYRGKIVSINRTPELIDDRTQPFRWRDFQSDRSARVILSLQENQQSEINQNTYPGMPAVVYFKRQAF